MKKIWKQWVKGHGTVIFEFKEKKIKCTYEYGNAYERFKIEIFDGDKLNQVGSMRDIGGEPDSSTYIYDESKIMSRYNNLMTNAQTYIKTLLS
jgi:hypothetical protein